MSLDRIKPYPLNPLAETLSNLLLWDGPKRRDAEKIRAAGIPTPRIFDTFREAAEAIKGGRHVLFRSENAIGSGHIEPSGLFTTFCVDKHGFGETHQDIIPYPEWEQAVIDGDEQAAYHFLASQQLNRQEPLQYAALFNISQPPPPNFSLWEYIQGTNLTLARDPINPLRFHFAIKKGEGYDQFIVNSDLTVQFLTNPDFPDAVHEQFIPLIETYYAADKALGNGTVKAMEMQITPAGQIFWLQSLPCPTHTPLLDKQTKLQTSDGDNNVPLSFFRGLKGTYQLNVLIEAGIVNGYLTIDDCKALRQQFPPEVNGFAITPPTNPAIMAFLLSRAQAYITPARKAGNIIRADHAARSAFFVPPFSGVIETRHLQAFLRKASNGLVQIKEFNLLSWDDIPLTLSWILLVLHSDGTNATLSYM